MGCSLVGWAQRELALAIEGFTRYEGNPGLFHNLAQLIRQAQGERAAAHPKRRHPEIIGHPQQGLVRRSCLVLDLGQTIAMVLHQEPSVISVATLLEREGHSRTAKSARCRLPLNILGYVD